MSTKTISAQRWIISAFVLDVLAFPAALLVWGVLSQHAVLNEFDPAVARLDLAVVAAALVFAYAMGLYRIEGLNSTDLRMPILAALLMSMLFALALSMVVGRLDLIRSRWLFILPVAFWIIFVNRWIFCQFTGLSALDFHHEIEKRQIPLDGLGQLAAESRLSPTRNLVSRGLKRTLDVSFCVVLLVFTLPVSLVAMLAILIEDGRPIFYRQERVGLNGRTFRLYKFRSMRCTAESDGVARWAQLNDPRVTKVGRFLRRSRIDEFPQFINVLLGDMSLVGPRPERPQIVQELEKAIPNYGRRHLVKPGITGWAQINYPYGASIQESTEKTKHDFYYLKHGSVILDVIILLQTVRVILLGEGSR